MAVAESAQWLSDAVTPSGIEIRYRTEPKREYQIRKGPKGRWKTVPSVTEAMKVLDKPGLVWWGQGVAIDGILEMVRLGLLRQYDGPQRGLIFHTGSTSGSQWVWAGKAEIEALLTQNRLSVNNMVDKASSRGLAVHDALEVWAQDGFLPDPAMFPETEAGYVAGLRQFLVESKAEPIASEVMVGSVKHGYAGRYDLRLRLPEFVELVVHRTPKRGKQRKLFEPSVLLCDLKTSKGVYSSHARQLEAYEQASIECGYEPTDGRAVLHVSDKGEYELVPSWADFRDYKVVLDVWRSDERMRQRKKEMK